MGRHSAPDDEDDVAVDASAVAVRERDDVDAPADPEVVFRGRHSGTPVPAAAAINATSAPPRQAPAPAPTPAPARPTPPAPPAPAAADEPADEHDVPLDELIAAGEPETLADTETGETEQGDTDRADTDRADTETIPAVRPGPPDSAPTDTTAPFQPVRDGDLSGEVSGDGSAEASSDGAARRSPSSVASHAAHNSAADLHLVRSHRGVLALCSLAILLPFVAEVVVLLVLGTLDAHSFVVWIWAPIVGAGVLLGVVLDLAHRHYSRLEPSSG